MDKKDLLKSVLQNFINDKPDEAKADFHQYLTLKSKEITGIGAPIQSQQEPAAVTPPAVDPTPAPEANVEGAEVAAIAAAAVESEVTA